MFLKHILDFLFPSSALEKKVDALLSNQEQQRPEVSRTEYGSYKAYSVFRYRNPSVRQLIWQLKYMSDKKVAAFFAENMYRALAEEFQKLAGWGNFKNPLLIPIPISRKRRWSRGFNQSEAMARVISSLDHGRIFEFCPHVLYKIKDTKSQARLKDKKDRLRNLKDSFFVKDNAAIAGRNIILLDDVRTTGSTLKEASRTLENAGAKSIIWVTIAC